MLRLFHLRDGISCLHFLLLKPPQPPNGFSGGKQNKSNRLTLVFWQRIAYDCSVILLSPSLNQQPCQTSTRILVARKGRKGIQTGHNNEQESLYHKEKKEKRLIFDFLCALRRKKSLIALLLLLFSNSTEPENHEDKVLFRLCDSNMLCVISHKFNHKSFG